MLRKSFKIGKRVIGDGRTFIIAEIGSNHNQKMDTAKKLIDSAVEAGADAVKFQSIKYDELYTPKKENRALEKLFAQIQLKEDWYEKLSAYCNKKKILLSAAPTYLKAVDILAELDVQFYKIASPQTATYPQLIKKVAGLKKPLIMSTGYCSPPEIDRAVKLVAKTGNEKLALLHCIAEYPTKPELANLKFIQSLKNKYKIPAGFSDHTLGWEVTIAAVAIGADIIEKHITLSRNQAGPDHFFSLEPDEFRRMIQDIRTVEKSTGSGMKLQITQNEADILNKIKMKAIAKRDIPQGAGLNEKKDVIFRRNNNGVDAWEIYQRSNLVVKRDVKKGEPITYKCVERDTRKKG